ncbi:hypothetical protein G5B47_02400 [Paenibacillus sp. 7124]|uniref:Uncharacterized protein n=1 Tax=Paenibacillus apii TaxID=1850370 RepID=A0A6M1PDA7_9BACL|nr:hypothetical protein [Paenibacillus apii]NGM81259.1 hypothetical protein [Paenibacillus apii]
MFDRADICVGRVYRSARGTVRRVDKIVIIGVDGRGYLFDVHYTRLGTNRRGVTCEYNFAKWAVEEVSADGTTQESVRQGAA